MKKIAALGMSAVMVAGMMAGCGSSSDSSSSDSKGSSKSGDKVELTLGIWDENQRDAMQKMIDAYEAENDNVSISIQLTPYKGGEYWTKLEASAGGGTAPDVFWLNVLHLDSYVEGGILDDLSDAMFEGEQIAMTLAGSYMVPEYASNDTIKDKIDCVEVPTFNGVEDNCINGLGFAVYEGSKQKEEAEKFAIWMGSSEAQKIQGETGVVISAREDAQQYFAKANEQYNLAAYTNHSAEAYPLPVCGKAAELYDMESTWLTKAYTGEMSLADACSGLKEEADALLAK